MASTIKVDTIQSTTSNVFFQNSVGTEYARFDSTGVFQLVNPSSFAAGTAAAPSITATGDTNTGIFFPAADTIAFSEGGVEAMRINSSGNLGLGVTPSAGWVGGFYAFQIGQTGCFASKAFSAPNTQTFIGNNVYYNHVAGNYQYIATGSAAARYALNQATHLWQVAATVGTADTAISFTDAMTLDASGNLRVGTTSASFSERLTVQSSTTTSASDVIIGRDSSATTLFRVRGDGAFQTGSGALSPYNNTTGSAANTFVNTDGTLLRSTSSLKYKKDVADATHGLTDLLKLRSVTYKGKNEADADKTFGGLIAEEVHDAGLTEFVHYSTDGSPDALNYGNMVSLCVKAIQEQQALITAQAETINALTARIVALESK